MLAGLAAPLGYVVPPITHTAPASAAPPDPEPLLELELLSELEASPPLDPDPLPELESEPVVTVSSPPSTGPGPYCWIPSAVSHAAAAAIAASPASTPARSSARDIRTLPCSLARRPTDRSALRLPTDKDQARQARFFERLSDLYLHDPLQTVLFDGRKPEAEREPRRVAAAKTWTLGESFSVADCSAAPALGYLRMIYPFDKHPNVVSYAGRLAERPSYRKVHDEAAPFLAKMMGR